MKASGRVLPWSIGTSCRAPSAPLLTRMLPGERARTQVFRTQPL